MTYFLQERLKLETELSNLSKEIIHSQNILALHLQQQQQVKHQINEPIQQSYLSKQESHQSQKQMRIQNANLKRLQVNKDAAQSEHLRSAEHLRQIVHSNNQEEEIIAQTIKQAKRIDLEINHVDVQIQKTHALILQTSNQDAALEKQWRDVDKAVESSLTNA